VNLQKDLKSTYIHSKKRKEKNQYISIDLSIYIDRKPVENLKKKREIEAFDEHI
jgi:hypothetical protein